MREFVGTVFSGRMVVFSTPNGPRSVFRDALDRVGRFQVGRMTADCPGCRLSLGFNPGKMETICPGCLLVLEPCVDPMWYGAGGVFLHASPLRQWKAVCLIPEGRLSVRRDSE